MKKLISCIVLGLCGLTLPAYVCADAFPYQGRYTGKEGRGEWSFTVTQVSDYYLLEGKVEIPVEGGKKITRTFSAQFDPRANKLAGGKIKGLPGTKLTGEYDPDKRLFNLILLARGTPIADLTCRYKGLDVTGTYIGEDGTRYIIVYLSKGIYRTTWNSFGTRGTLVGKFDGETYSGRLTTNSNAASTFGTFYLVFGAGPPLRFGGEFIWGGGLRVDPHTLTKE